MEADDSGLGTPRCGQGDTDPLCGAPHDGEPPESDLLGRVGDAVRGAHDAGVPF